MDMASCSGTGGTNISDDISPLDASGPLVPHSSGCGIIGGKTMAMGDHNNITSASVPTGKDNNTVCCRREGVPAPAEISRPR